MRKNCASTPCAPATASIIPFPDDSKARDRLRTNHNYRFALRARHKSYFFLDSAERHLIHDLWRQMNPETRGIALEMLRALNRPLAAPQAQQNEIPAPRPALELVHSGQESFSWRHENGHHLALVHSRQEAI